MRYVDVNIFVYWLGDDPAHGKRATKIIERVENGEVAATSTLTLWLTHIVLSRLAARYSAKEMLKRLKELVFLKIEPLQVDDFDEAVSSIEKYDLELEDAVHLATAVRLGVKEIYTFDEDFKRTPLQVLSK